VPWVRMASRRRLAAATAASECQRGRTMRPWRPSGRWHIRELRGVALALGGTRSGPCFALGHLANVINTTFSCVDQPVVHPFRMIGCLIHACSKQRHLALQMKVNERSTAQKGEHNSLIGSKTWRKRNCGHAGMRFCGGAVFDGVETTFVVAVAPDLDLGPTFRPTEWGSAAEGPNHQPVSSPERSTASTERAQSRTTQFIGVVYGWRFSH